MSLTRVPPSVSTILLPLRRLALAGALVLPGCGQVSTNTNTDWLGPCETDTQCAGGTACFCGVCTRPCTTDTDCLNLAPELCRTDQSCRATTGLCARDAEAELRPSESVVTEVPPLGTNPDAPPGPTITQCEYAETLSHNSDYTQEERLYDCSGVSLRAYCEKEGDGGHCVCTSSWKDPTLGYAPVPTGAAVHSAPYVEFDEALMDEMFLLAIPACREALDNPGLGTCHDEEFALDDECFVVRRCSLPLEGEGTNGARRTGTFLVEKGLYCWEEEDGPACRCGTREVEISASYAADEYCSSVAFEWCFTSTYPQ